MNISNELLEKVYGVGDGELMGRSISVDLYEKIADDYEEVQFILQNKEISCFSNRVLGTDADALHWFKNLLDAYDSVPTTVIEELDTFTEMNPALRFMLMGVRDHRDAIERIIDRLTFNFDSVWFSVYPRALADFTITVHPDSWNFKSVTDMHNPTVEDFFRVVSKYGLVGLYKNLMKQPMPFEDVRQITDEKLDEGNATARREFFALLGTVIFVKGGEQQTHYTLNADAVEYYGLFELLQKYLEEAHECF